MMTLAEINAMTRDQFVATLGWIFEDSAWVAERAWAYHPFASREALHRSMTGELEKAVPAEQLALLRAHPDLGARARVSAASAGEQSGAGMDRLSAEEFEMFEWLNAGYREKFGFPFLYAVKGSTKHDIFVALGVRMDSSPEEEFRQALSEVSRIAWFRLEDTIAQ
ncbi:MAG TPA: 2-oxo-4-hydroxy-4-carboxy-5-ureidoimidazoline decarboxylase [Bryobacteraceae bacterium]|jgi:2-oxo-4-hydroxy-4-carboxy-5-ureidoimidazoline decarboxylase|nr:2-oxo-4-hydroxy-4-carboxy-5-ureidoimidazoline decarboxylase [Bryobacteraceae bacterium]